MTIAVRYLSKSGNTEKVAQAIAQAVGVVAEPILKPILEDTDLLFLGCAIYAFGIDEQIKTFIQSLDDRVKKVAVFSTTALVKSAYPNVKKLLEAKNIPVLAEEFHCKGVFKFLNKNKPNSEDLIRAAKFAKSVVE